MFSIICFRTYCQKPSAKKVSLVYGRASPRTMLVWDLTLCWPSSSWSRWIKLIADMCWKMKVQRVVCSVRVPFVEWELSWVIRKKVVYRIYLSSLVLLKWVLCQISANQTHGLTFIIWNGGHFRNFFENFVVLLNGHINLICMGPWCQHRQNVGRLTAADPVKTCRCCQLTFQQDVFLVTRSIFNKARTNLDIWKKNCFQLLLAAKTCLCKIDSCTDVEAFYFDFV